MFYLYMSSLEEALASTFTNELPINSTNHFSLSISSDCEEREILFLIQEPSCPDVRKREKIILTMRTGNR